MAAQLSAAFPIGTYPIVVVLPDGGVAVSAGKLLVKYKRAGDATFTKELPYPDRPTAPWSCKSPWRRWGRLEETSTASWARR